MFYSWIYILYDVEQSCKLVKIDHKSFNMSEIQFETQSNLYEFLSWGSQQAVAALASADYVSNFIYSKHFDQLLAQIVILLMSIFLLVQSCSCTVLLNMVRAGCRQAHAWFAKCYKGALN